MKINRIILLLLLVHFHLALNAQDVTPEMNFSGEKLSTTTPVPSLVASSKMIDVSDSMPIFFLGTTENQIVDSMQILSPLFERLSHAINRVSDDTVTILHVGDSHIRGHFFPQRVGMLLKEKFSQLHYHDMGVNGATCLTFTHPKRIAKIKAYHPDLLILSFGTNESYNRAYSPSIHYRQLDEFINLIRKELPDVPVLLTTPPGCFRRVGWRRYRHNPNSEKASQVIVRFARQHHFAYWDLFHIVGGDEHACNNWLNNQFMRPDHIHFFEEGYNLQGDLFFQALIKAYNNYVSL